MKLIIHQYVMQFYPTPGELTFPILKRNAGEGLVVSEKSFKSHEFFISTF